MAKFSFGPLVDSTEVITARLGAGTGSANFLTDADRNKFVKLAGPSRYDLAAVGDEIEGVITSIETTPQDNYSIGGVAIEAPFINVTFDGSQVAGTGALAIGDYVVVGTPVAKGTSLGVLPYPKVRKATDQAAAKSSPFAWRVADLGTAGNGNVGTTGVIQQVC